jgi:hypothetical protein
MLRFSYLYTSQYLLAGGSTVYTSLLAKLAGGIEFMSYYQVSEWLPGTYRIISPELVYMELIVGETIRGVNY